MRKWITLIALLAATGSVLIIPTHARSAPSVQFGVEDDAWLVSGPGTLDDRLATLDRLGVDVVRLTVPWYRIAPTAPANARDPQDPAYQWGDYDAAIRGLKAHHIAVMLTLWGAPGWSNGGKGPNGLPVSKTSLAAFAFAVAKRYPWIHRWTIWNEPNQRIFLLPTSPALYVARLLNPAYAALKSASSANVVAGGVTSPRGGPSGVAPQVWIRGMKAAHARLDAYAQNPYPLRRNETPSSGGCEKCDAYTLATLPKLIAEVKRDFGGRTRVWLTEYGNNSKPPSRWLGVPNAVQARYVSEADLQAYEASHVDVLINFLVQDEQGGPWSSGFMTSRGIAKPSFKAFTLPIAEVSRVGLKTVIWGQVRPRQGEQRYRLQHMVNGHWAWAGATASTSGRGYWRRVVHAGAGARFRIWSPADHEFGLVLKIH